MKGQSRAEKLPSRWLARSHWTVPSRVLISMADKVRASDVSELARMLRRDARGQHHFKDGAAEEAHDHGKAAIAGLPCSTPVGFGELRGLS